MRCRIARTPWMPEPGDEDRAWLQGSWALDELNGRAVEAEGKAPHDAVIGMTKHGAFSAPSAPASRRCRAIRKVFWAARPRGVAWRDVIPGIVTSPSSPPSVWRRQMVPGPSTGFAIVGAPGFSLTRPRGWRAAAVERRRL